MIKNTRKRLCSGRRVYSALMILASLAVVLTASPIKKLEVTAETADIHLEPDAKSMVLETLDRGTLLTRGSPRTFKRVWCYVYFTSDRSGKSKSGYVQTSKVKKLFRTTRTHTIR